MTDPELNEGVARARGWVPDFGFSNTGAVLWTLDGKEVLLPPDFLHDPRAFVDLLEFHAKAGREPEVGYSNFNDAGREWYAALGQVSCAEAALGRGDTPARALVLATISWKGDAS